MTLSAAASLDTPRASLASLAADEQALAYVIDRGSVCLGTEDRSIAASFLLNRLARRVIEPLAVTYLADNCVPAVDPTTVTLRFDTTGAPGRVSFPTSAFYALSSDPAARQPDALVVEHACDLRAQLRRTVAATLAELIPALRPWARRGPATQWACLSDAFANALSRVAEDLGDQARGCAEADRVLDGTPPFTSPGAWREVRGHGTTRTWRVRNTCCLAYRLDGHGYCLTCPLEDDDVRVARWRQRIGEPRG